MNQDASDAVIKFIEILKTRSFIFCFYLFTEKWHKFETKLLDYLRELAAQITFVDRLNFFFLI